MDKQEKTVKSNLIFGGKVVSLYVDDVKCPNGNISKREIVRHNGGVCVLAIVDNKVIIAPTVPATITDDSVILSSAKSYEELSALFEQLT